jgi:putative peptidoglycan lipid II flippase
LNKGDLKPPEVARKSVAGQALIMSLGTFSSRWLGLVRESLLAYFFDRTVTDAWITAFRVPNFFRRLLGEGSLSVSFIPVFADLRVQSPDIGPEIGPNGGPSLRVRNFINGFYTLLLLILSTLTVFGVLYLNFLFGFWLIIQVFPWFQANLSSRSG